MEKEGVDRREIIKDERKKNEWKNERNVEEKMRELKKERVVVLKNDNMMGRKIIYMENLGIKKEKVEK